MLSNKTDEFKEYFAQDKIDFDTDYWMDIFDKQENDKETNDSQKRGFKNGHADLGFGREGVSQSAEVSQKGKKDILFAIPHLIHKDKFDYQKLGNIPDQIQLLADKYIRDNGKVSVKNIEYSFRLNPAVEYSIRLISNSPPQLNSNSN